MTVIHGENLIQELAFVKTGIRVSPFETVFPRLRLYYSVQINTSGSRPIVHDINALPRSSLLSYEGHSTLTLRTTAARNMLHA
jgi:hypothetical protein